MVMLHRRLEVASLWLAAAPAALLCLAGAVKLFDLPSFHAELVSWTMMGREVRSVATILVPSVEVGVSGMYLLGMRGGLSVRQRVLSLCMLVLIVIFTLAFSAQWRYWQQPSCGCFGVVSPYISHINSGVGVFVRNAVLMLALAPACFVGMYRRRMGSHDHTMLYTD